MLADPTARVGLIHLSGRARAGDGATVTIGPRSSIQDGVVLRLGPGARLDIGPDVVIRRGAVLNVAGHLELRGRNLVSWYSVIHCAGTVVLGEMTGTGEHVTIVDSTHVHGARGAADEHWYHNAVIERVEIGPNSWLATKSTVAAGAVLGERTVVAAHAVVLGGSYPPGVTLVGLPARVVRSGPLESSDRHDADHSGERSHQEGHRGDKGEQRGEPGVERPDDSADRVAWRRRTG